MTACRIPEVWYLTCDHDGCEESTEDYDPPARARAEAEKAAGVEWVTAEDNGRHYCPEHAGDAEVTRG